MRTLYERLKDYGESEDYGFHMPGHKRNKNIMKADLPFEIDITEIDGFDDLHHADGIIREAEKRASDIYHADETHFLVNGSTSGILSAVLGCTDRGGKILMSRNCHKSVYHAVFMNDLHPVYVYPRFSEEMQLNGQISPSDIADLLENEEGIEAAVIVSPSYDGVVSEIAEIAELMHKKGIPFIVDEAHGAHFGIHPYFPSNANQKGADVVIHSTHKTLPALTQTALIHMNGKYADRERIRNYLQMVQTSSPSYVLMASIDECMELLEQNGKNIFDDYADRLQRLRNELSRLKNLKLLETDCFDKSKVVISTRHTRLTGKDLYDILKDQYHIQLEMAAGTYIIAMTSVCDTDEAMARLCKALYDIDGSLQPVINNRSAKGLPKPEFVYTSAEIDRRIRENQNQRKYLAWTDAVGKISTEYAYLYPPGCPLIVPGERITKEVADQLNWYEKSGFTIEGIHVDKKIGVWISE